MRRSRLRSAAVWATALLLLAGCGKPARTAPAATKSATGSPTAATFSGHPASALHLDTVDFLPGGVGWVAGHLGTRVEMLRTLDDGATWEELPAGGSPFLSLDFVNPDSGWALVGSGGQVQIEHSSDGGATWKVQWLGAAQGMQFVVALEDARIAMLDGRNGHAVFGGQLLATADGGATWRALSLPADFTPSSMVWRDVLDGLVAGTACTSACHAAVLATSDGGATWATVFTATETLASVNAGAALPGIAFPTAQAGWLYFKTADLTGRLYATEDGGASWTLEQADLAGGRTVAGLPVFADARTGWLPIDNGAAPFAGGVEVTHDGGQSWTWVGQHRGWSVTAMSAVSAGEVWAVGRPAGSATSTFLVHSANGGDVWAEDGLTLRPVRAVDFVGSSVGFGVGAASDPGAVLRSTDGGATWSVRAILPGTVEAVSFIDASHGWALDQPWPPSQQIVDVMATTDGGAKWTEVGMLAQASVPVPTELRFFDAQHGMVMMGAVPDWQVITTSDGGQTWTRTGGRRIDPGTSVMAAMPSAGSLYLLESPAKLLHSADGGATWTSVPALPGDRGDGVGIAASGPKRLWVILQHLADGAEQTTLERTSDGGATWSHVTLPPKMPLDPPLSVSAPGGGDAWVLSMEGLFATRDGGRTWTWVR